MSAPETNLKTQRRRHIGPLTGIAIVLLLVGAGFLWWLTYEVGDTDPPAEVPTELAPDLAPPVETEPETIVEPPPSE